MNEEEEAREWKTGSRRGQRRRGREKEVVFSGGSNQKSKETRKNEVKKRQFTCYVQGGKAHLMSAEQGGDDETERGREEQAVLVLEMACKEERKGTLKLQGDCYGKNLFFMLFFLPITTLVCYFAVLIATPLINKLLNRLLLF